MIHAQRVTKDGEDIGFVGEVTSVDTKPILDTLDRGYIPVIATLGCGGDGTVYNINADVAAARIAAELGAENLVSMTDVRGLLRDRTDEGTLIPEVRVSDVPQLVRQGIIQGGMIPKVECCVEGGAPRRAPRVYHRRAHPALPAHRTDDKRGHRHHVRRMMPGLAAAAAEGGFENGRCTT